MTAKEKARDFLLDNGAFDRNTNFGLFSKDSGVTYRSRICHREIGETPYDNGSKRFVPEYVATEISIHRKPEDTTEIYEPFLKWFLYDSFFSPFIENADDYEFCRDHGLILSCDIPQNVLQGICILSRHFHEIPVHVFAEFNGLVSAGVIPELAYSYCMNTHHKTCKEKETYPVSSISVHRAWPLFSLEGLKAFRKKSPIGSLTNPYRENYSTSKVVSLFVCSAPTDMIDDLMGMKNFRKKLGAFRCKGAEKKMYRPPNPFKDSFPGPRFLYPNQVTYKEFEEVCIPFIMEEKLYE